MKRHWKHGGVKYHGIGMGIKLKPGWHNSLCVGVGTVLQQKFHPMFCFQCSTNSYISTNYRWYIHISPPPLDFIPKRSSGHSQYLFIKVGIYTHNLFAVIHPHQIVIISFSLNEDNVYIPNASNTLSKHENNYRHECSLSKSILWPPSCEANWGQLQNPVGQWLMGERGYNVPSWYQ